MRLGLRLLLTFPLASRSFAPSLVLSRRFGKTALHTAMPKVLVPLSVGSEEIETSCVTDTLTRFGCDVTVASVTGDLKIVMSRGLKIEADTLISSVVEEEYDAIVLPGGMPGAEGLRDSAELTRMLKKQHERGKIIGAVCAAPAIVLGAHGLIGDKATCYPAGHFREALGEAASNDSVVCDNNIVTSQGPGTSLAFAIELGSILVSKDKADEIKKEMLVERS